MSQGLENTSVEEINLLETLGERLLEEYYQELVFLLERNKILCVVQELNEYYKEKEVGAEFLSVLRDHVEKRLENDVGNEFLNSTLLGIIDNPTIYMEIFKTSIFFTKKMKESLNE